MLLDGELIKHFYECSMEYYNDINDIDEEDYPNWKSLNPVMQLNIEAAIYKACEKLIIAIWGGGHYNDTDLNEFITEELAPMVSAIRQSKK